MQVVSTKGAAGVRNQQHTDECKAVMAANPSQMMKALDADKQEVVLRCPDAVRRWFQRPRA